MASFVSISSPTLFYKTPHLSPPFPSIPSIPRPKIDPFKGAWGRQWVLKCLSEPSEDAAAEESKPGPDSLETSSSYDASISAYSWCAGLGGLGFLETGYLTYLKLTNSDAFCPVGGGSCDDILNSDYALVFGVPLPLIGMIAYGLVMAVALQMAGKDSHLGIGETNGRMILLAITTSMATASTYFLYILSTKFAGDSCAYCLVSVLLSFSLLFTALKASGLQEIQKVVGLQLCIAALVVTTLSTSYSRTVPLSSSQAEADLPFFTTKITTQSSSATISLARHLHSIGAKMYGAFWCSHCVEQKQMFGQEAAKLLDYVECFPDGYRKGVKIDKACAAAGIEGFPTWVINGQVLSGELELSELARVSGF